MTQFNSQTDKEKELTGTNPKSNRFTKFQWVGSVCLFIVTFQLLMTKDFLSALMLLLGGLLLLPPLTELLHSKLPFLRNNWIKGGIILGLIMIGMNTSSEIVAQKEAEKRLEQQEKELIKRAKFIANYIKENQDKSIKNIAKLQQVGTFFNQTNPNDLKEIKYDSVTKKSIWVFNSQYNFENAKQYLLPYGENGVIEKYIVKYEIDCNNEPEVVSKKSYITYSKTGQTEYDNNKVPSVFKLINEPVVEKQIEIFREQEEIAKAKRLLEKQKEEYNKRCKDFEKKCLSPWDGSNIKLKRYVKERMNDPESFEHIKTSYRLFTDYAVLTMRFRGKNAFNALVTNKVVAKINLENCEVIEAHY